MLSRIAKVTAALYLIVFLSPRCYWGIFVTFGRHQKVFLQMGNLEQASIYFHIAEEVITCCVLRGFGGKSV